MPEMLDSDLAVDVDQPHQSSSVRQVLGDPQLLARIMGFLADGEATDLVKSLRVSKAFFRGAASTLCRRIEVPLFEFSATKSRGFHYDRTYESDCPRPTPYWIPAGCTAHRAMEPEAISYAQTRDSSALVAWYPATTMMKRLYDHVRVVTVEYHDGCDRLAQTHPLPSVRTVIVRGSHGEECAPLKPRYNSYCGFLPRHPFRLILDEVCPGMMCRDCTPDRLLPLNVETLVISLDYEPHYLRCRTSKFPPHFNPQRLVILFQQERVPNGYERLGQDPEECRYSEGTFAYAPEDQKNPLINLFYRIARMILMTGHETRVYIVGADQLALHTRGLERLDKSLENHQPKYPHYLPGSRPRKAPEGSSHPLGIILPKGASWEYDEGCELPIGYCDADGAQHDAYEGMDLSDGEGDDEDDQEKKERKDLASLRNACYSQDGKVISATKPQKIPEELLPRAKALIDKRVSAIEALVHRWIDHILDRRIPAEDWHEQETKDKWPDRDAFERDSFDRRAKSRQQEQQKWFDSHTCDPDECTYRCNYPGVPDSDVEDELGRLIDETQHEVDFELPSESVVEQPGRQLQKVGKRVVKAKQWREGQEHQPTKQEVVYRRRKAHERISFISTFEYHRIEGNNDEMDNPDSYV